MAAERTKTIKVDYLARVEGEGAMTVKLRGGKVTDVKLRIFEPPRFFEGFLRGRHFSEAPDITARICGICPTAYQMSSVHAMERAMGVQVGGALRALRRLLYCGEWIESHVLHIYMLHAPDFLGFQGAVQMAQAHGERVKQGLALKKTGNDLMALLGGREIHPVNVRVGGFYRVPTRGELQALRPALEAGLEQALDMVRWVSGFTFPELARDYLFVSLFHPEEYPFNEGRIVSSAGLDIDVADYEQHFTESHVAHSNALHSHLQGKPFFVGPMARYALCFEHLTPLARKAALEAGLGPRCSNPFKSIIVRAVETVFAFEEALRIVEAYEPPLEPFVAVPVRAASGWGASEAPRGLLYHRYEIDAGGLIQTANIVPPTAQNQPTIEEDLRQMVPSYLHLDDAALTHQCEQAIRNYDPCISCATHFLDLTIDRGEAPERTDA